MRYRIGRILQVIGMLILPPAIVGELLGKLTLNQSLLIALAGAAVFVLGVRVQRTAA